jgi:hypothetical protein
MNLSSLLSWTFWTSIPDMMTTGGRVVGAFMLGLLFVGVVVRLVNGRKNLDRHLERVFARVGRLLTVMGILGTVLVFMSYEAIPFFGDRLWYVVWVVATIIWAARIAVFVKVRLPQIRAEEGNRTEREKYLPGRA